MEIAEGRRKSDVSSSTSAEDRDEGRSGDWEVAREVRRRRLEGGSEGRTPSRAPIVMVEWRKGEIDLTLELRLMYESITSFANILIGIRGQFFCMTTPN